MKIALLGYGRMGHEVEHQAKLRNHEISAIFDIDDAFSATSDLNGAEIIISFTLADAVLPNVMAAAKQRIPIVEGTTGWYDRLPALENIKDVSILYSPNFSIGVYRFTQLVKYAAKLFAPHPEYDCFLHEFHHTGKADSPSGTAKKLATILVDNLPSKTEPLYDTSHGLIDPNKLHVTSTRVGRNPGEHIIGFDAPADEIRLTHVAHGREGFALGAVLAAEWLIGKKGIFTMDDFMSDMFPAI